eukprot:363909_1
MSWFYTASSVGPRVRRGSSTHDNQSPTGAKQSVNSNSIPVSDYLSARYLLKSLNDDILDECYNEIIKSFDNKQDIIYLLIKSSSADQLKTIIQTLKQAQSKSIENNNYKIISHSSNENKQSYFDYLSNESIHNICDFLSKEDMNTFKMVCVSVSLVIFEIMKCYIIGVFDMNELIETNEYKNETNLNILNKKK